MAQARIAGADIASAFIKAWVQIPRGSVFAVTLASVDYWNTTLRHHKLGDAVNVPVLMLPSLKGKGFRMLQDAFPSDTGRDSRMDNPRSALQFMLAVTSDPSTVRLFNTGGKGLTVKALRDEKTMRENERAIEFAASPWSHELPGNFPTGKFCRVRLSWQMRGAVPGVFYKL